MPLLIQRHPFFDRQLNPFEEMWKHLDEVSTNLVTDLYETDEAIHVEALIPGMGPEDITLAITGDTLKISGVQADQKELEDKKRNYYQQEIRRGSFEESFELPVAVQADKAEAHFDKGVLKISLPKAEEMKPKQILIKPSEG